MTATRQAFPLSEVEGHASRVEVRSPFRCPDATPSASVRNQVLVDVRYYARIRSDPASDTRRVRPARGPDRDQQAEDLQRPAPKPILGIVRRPAQRDDALGEEACGFLGTLGLIAGGAAEVQISDLLYDGGTNCTARRTEPGQWQCCRCCRCRPARPRGRAPNVWPTACTNQ